MRSRKIREIDTAFKPIVRDRHISVVSMIAYLGIVFSVLFLQQFVLIHIFNKLYPLSGNMEAAILPIIVISVLVILLWSIRYVRFPVILILFAIYAAWLFFRITSNPETPNDVRTFLDVFLRSLSEYYGFTWKGFGEGSDVGFLAAKAAENTVLNAILLIYLPFTALLGYSMIRKFRFTSVALVLMLPCFIVMMNGYMPDRFALMMVIFIFAALAVLGIQMKIEEKQQLVAQNREAQGAASPFCLRPPKSVVPLYMIVAATCIAAMAFPPMLEDKINEAVKPAQDFMYSGGPEKLLRSIRKRMFGTNAGGISGGDLASTGSIKPDKDHVLLSVVRTTNVSQRYAYLKCYVGEVYNGKRWSNLPPLILDQYADRISTEFSRREYARLGSAESLLYGYSMYNSGDMRLYNMLNITPTTTYITNIDYTDGYYAIPYMVNFPNTVKTAVQPYFRGDMEVGSTLMYKNMYCQSNTLVRLYDAYCHEHGYLSGVSDTPQNLADDFYNEIYDLYGFGSLSQDNGRAIPQYIFDYYGSDFSSPEDEAYNQILNEYLNVPDSVVKLREYLSNVQLDGVEDAIIFVRDTLDEMAEYSLNPGRISSDQDYVDTFLFEKKEGYCMHFATAGTIMFRLLGIPARYVEGFYLAPWGNGEQEVTEENAHAWTEIYLRNFGWIPIEVTPGFGADEWQRREVKKPKPTESSTTEAQSGSETTAVTKTTDSGEGSTVAPTEVQQVPGQSGAVVIGSRPSEEGNDGGSSIFPVLIKILKVVGIILGILLVVYLLILLRRSMLLSRRYRGFTQKDAKKSISALYADMRRLAAIEQHRFTYESDAADVVSWFDDLAEEEELFAEAIEMINLCFFGNRELTPDERKIVRVARNKLAKSVASRQTGKKKWRFRLWYGY